MADSEVRQKFEAWAKKVIADDPLDFEECHCSKWFHYVSPVSAWAFESYKAGMRAGEIAMREKAAEGFDSAIRTLPLSSDEQKS